MQSVTTPAGESVEATETETSWCYRTLTHAETKTQAISYDAIARSCFSISVPHFTLSDFLSLEFLGSFLGTDVKK